MLINVIRYSYYEKPVTTPIVFHTRGGYAWRSKIVILAEEGKRRLMNRDSIHTEQETVLIMKKFIQKMSDSGYDYATRMEILNSGVT